MCLFKIFFNLEVLDYNFFERVKIDFISQNGLLQYRAKIGDIVLKVARVLPKNLQL
jgi:hypothetical protein